LYDQVSINEGEYVQNHASSYLKKSNCCFLWHQFIITLTCIILLPASVKIQYFPSPFDPDNFISNACKELLASKTASSFRNLSTVSSSDAIIPTKFKDSGMILFLHLHKAGGTMMIKGVFQSKKKPKGMNGNAWDDKGIVEFWHYKNDELHEFANRLKGNGVEVLVTEWNFFSRYDELDLAIFRLITCIREPYERFKSNWRVEASIDRTEDPALWHTKTITWSRKKNHFSQRFLVNYNMPNYYVAMMNGFGNDPKAKITRAHLEIAKKRLLKFDAVTILEVPESFSLLEHYGVQWDSKKKNVNTNKEEFTYTKEEFQKENGLDYEFYEYAKKLSKAMRVANGLP